MKKNTIVTALVLILAATLAVAQVSPRDSIVFTSLVSPSAAICFPGGDLADRFGVNGALGGGFMIKTRKNWLYGLQYDFLFGNDVKQQEILDNLKTSGGFIISEAGTPAEIDMFERGHSVLLKGGKIVPHLWGENTRIGPNENCGLLFMAGIGWLQHTIHITGTTLQLTKEYKQGYDRLTYGLSASQFIGYFHLSNNRMLNFYIGMEFIEGWTVNRRGYNFDEMAADSEGRLDVMTCFKAGWMLPLYKKVSDEFYYH
jgi:hypothetical protein